MNAIIADFVQLAVLLVVPFLTEVRDFSLLHSIQINSGAHTVSYPTGTCGSFYEVETAGSEADHSPLSAAEVNNDGAIPSIHLRFS